MNELTTRELQAVNGGIVWGAAVGVALIAICVIVARRCAA